jgi:hypothetical protein
VTIRTSHLQPAHRSWRALVLGIGLASTTLLAGCAPADSPSPATAADPTAQAAKTIDMPDLWPSPAPDVLTDDEVEQLRVTQQDSDWNSVASAYPTAVRPAVQFEGYTSDKTYIDTLNACYVASDLKLNHFVSEIGEPTLNGTDVSNESEAIAKYVCLATVVAKPFTWNEAQIGYHYDYLTKFLAPCYKTNGIDNPSAPSREEYIAQWPHPNWTPTLGDLFGTPEAAPIVAACPGPYN